MQERTRSIEPGRDEQRPLAVIAWIAVLALIGVFAGLQVASFLKTASMDVQIYYDAAVALRLGEDMFAPWGDGHPLTYIYPPLLAILFMPLTYLPLEEAASVWTVINAGLLLGCLWIGAAEMLRRFNSRLDRATLPVAMLVAALIFLPRIKAEFDQGQVDFLVLFGITIGLLLIKRYPLLAGVVLGVVANIKYQTAIFLPYFLVRGWWTASVGLVGGAIGAALSGALVIGWATNLEYLERAFSGLGSMIGLSASVESGQSLPFIFPMSWGESVSLSSTFARWSESMGFGEVGTGVMIAVAAILCLVLGWVLYARAGAALFRGRAGSVARMAPEQQPLIALEWTGLIMATIAFAPQTKMRHLALLLIVMILVAQLLVVWRKGVPRWPLLIAVVIMLIGLSLPPGAPEEMREWRKAWRAQGGPSWCLLLVYFTMLWTALRWIRLAPSTSSSALMKSSPALDQSVDEVR